MKKLLFIILALFISLPAVADSTQQNHITNSTQKNMLLDALKVAQSKLSNFLQSHLVAYTREKVDSDGEIESYRFTPVSSSTGNWNRLDTSYSANEHETKVWESDIFFRSENLHLDDMKLISESNSTLVFKMPISLSLTVDSEHVDDKSENKDSFMVELSFDKKSKLVTASKIFSIKAFNPQLGVTVESFQLTNTLKELYAGGPLVISEQFESVRGDFGIFISIDEDTKTKNFDFAILALDDKKLSLADKLLLEKGVGDN